MDHNMVFQLRFDQKKEAVTTNECTSVAGHSDSHGGATVQYRGHCLKLLKMGSSCPNNNNGVTFQTDEKHLNNTAE